jgi:hypothetical protein
VVVYVDPQRNGHILWDPTKHNMDENYDFCSRCMDDGMMEIWLNEMHEDSSHEEVDEIRYDDRIDMLSDVGENPTDLNDISFDVEENFSNHIMTLSDADEGPSNPRSFTGEPDDKYNVTDQEAQDPTELPFPNRLMHILKKIREKNDEEQRIEPSKSLEVLQRNCQYMIDEQKRREEIKRGKQPMKRTKKEKKKIDAA